MVGNACAETVRYVAQVLRLCPQCHVAVVRHVGAALISCCFISAQAHTLLKAPHFPRSAGRLLSYDCSFRGKKLYANKPMPLNNTVLMH
jgi:hypothetical protein